MVCVCKAFVLLNRGYWQSPSQSFTRLNKIHPLLFNLVYFLHIYCEINLNYWTSFLRVFTILLFHTFNICLQQLIWFILLNSCKNGTLWLLSLFFLLSLISFPEWVKMHSQRHTRVYPSVDFKMLMSFFLNSHSCSLFRFLSNLLTMTIRNLHFVWKYFGGSSEKYEKTNPSLLNYFFQMPPTIDMELICYCTLISQMIYPAER